MSRASATSAAFQEDPRELGITLLKPADIGVIFSLGCVQSAKL